ncbi:hypothetical protein DUK53_16145 [Listeria sp. SHR_NRA_18]|uniref:hypothetical protein n=1 Tax=Listeria sp. SHR_NRA_18 TaxID=2269046 RepID=UPI00051D0281|nr:hypothetical protein [Listeria sp. SHR_NRA_18]KGL44481.1 hypothetical protein EP56_07730 [Listeriaceae bacterium FSL A5-0209]RQW65482.1 hypothetical protein DUK53_16145 [Listeria sp. SHR_NRA_18]
MRYEDIDQAFSPIRENITTEQLHMTGDFTQDSKIYFSVNDGPRLYAETDIGGFFEYDFEALIVGDVVNFYIKDKSNYTVFFTETIRE